jgi:hypothetical protein
MQPFQAIAHHQPNHQYSPFHATLEYSLRHLYSLSNAQIFLSETLGWSEADAKNIKHGTIDVYKDVVWIHVPQKCPKGNCIKGISRFVSKNEFVKILIAKCWSKADPYKLEIVDWDEFAVLGNSGEHYELHLTPFVVTCNCHAASGTAKAFQEDTKAYLFLRYHSDLLGQLPDKHIFAVWKYLGVNSQPQYEQAYRDREEKACRFIPDFEEIEF